MPAPDDSAWTRQAPRAAIPQRNTRMRPSGPKTDPVHRGAAAARGFLAHRGRQAYL